MSDHKAYIEVLSRDECLQLLPTAPVGWIAHCSAGDPQLVPVNYVVHEGEVIVRSGYGSKLAAAAHGLAMAFGVDGIDPSTRTGWSVTASGPARVIGDELEVAVLGVPLVEVWAPGEKESYIAISLREVSGRRIGRPVDRWQPAR
ncbi:pyridoxamine 5'-phosphate oxidase family protein [Geodermatophilus sp. TF02-6]|uniref:pyridoxamine 5'-phosphate oxidase family protein n=1 Tax=Geodermatophilus sp. TF02-6 TaxID=2250575 RepID=UPI0013144033|nr:pyridoxamine 5'-phosphate oxidase family protein [Geodermatophilus sp. TF02-6]